MHELLLYGQVPVPRHEQVLKILAGVAAMQPQPLYERQMIFRPSPSTEHIKPDKRYPNRPVKPQTLVYHQLIKALAENEFGKESPLAADSDADDASARSWLMRAQEIPEPETKTVTLRQVRETEVTGANVQNMLESGNYRLGLQLSSKRGNADCCSSCVKEFFLEGHRFVHKNVVLTVFRLLRANAIQPPSAPMATLPSLESLVPLDPSGGFVLEARVRVDDRSKPKLVSAATDELNAFREMMRSSIDMKAPDRLALDTRVR